MVPLQLGRLVSPKEDGKGEQPEEFEDRMGDEKLYLIGEKIIANEYD